MQVTVTQCEMACHDLTCTGARERTVWCSAKSLWCKL